jgi:hypothetical protein
MHLRDAPFAENRFRTVRGQRTTCIGEGEGDAIVLAPLFGVLGPWERFETR